MICKYTKYTFNDTDMFITCLRWVFMKENKKSKETKKNTLSTKKTIKKKKKKENTLSTKKATKKKGKNYIFFLVVFLA